MSGVLTLMGSGETSPTMVATHRRVFDRIGERPAVMLDTPFGFQENADIIAEKAVEYFNVSLRRRVEVASFRNADTATALERETMIARVRDAGWVFAAPGSPTYAVRQWRDTEFSSVLADKVTTAARAVTFASAAAITLGTYVLPVYEIYKVGAPLHWDDGLDLLGRLGYPCAVIPHFDNAEGGNHDTRFCYMGERRLNLLRELLPPYTPVVGIDEHTAAVIDLEAASISVEGRGSLTVLLDDSVTVVPAGETAPIAVLSGAGATPAGNAEAAAPVTVPATDPLAESIEGAEDTFAAALSRRDAAGAVAAILDLDQALQDWSADTLQSDLPDRGRSLLRSMIVRLGDAATEGVVDPAERIRGFVELVLTARDRARDRKDFEQSDQLRDGLLALGLEIRDTPDGTEWHLPG